MLRGVVLWPFKAPQFILGSFWRLVVLFSVLEMDLLAWYPPVAKKPFGRHSHIHGYPSESGVV